MSTHPSNGPDEEETPSHLSAGFLVGGGRYTLLRQIARGGMGVVWLAQDERLNEAVALKFLSSLVLNDSVELARLRQETQKSRKLTHANIIRIYDLYEAPGEPAFISMEYVNGPNLWELMTQQTNGVFAWADLKPLVKQLCDALAYAHGERVIHRDLKPTNLMLAENQRLKLADFGVATAALQADPASVERHFGGGTLTHMSPQQLEGEAAALTDDIYSLGATLYDLLCGLPPFHEGDIRHQLLHTPAPPLQDRLTVLATPNDVPSEVAAMIMACLAKDPSQRPQSALAVAEWIGLTTVESPSVPHLAATVFSDPPASQPKEEPPRTGAWRWLIILGGLVCCAVVFWLYRRTPPPVVSPVPVPSNAVVVVSEVSVEKPHSNASPAPSPPPVSVPTPENLLDASFDAGRGPDGEINDLALQADGGILVAGRFNSFDGVARRGLVRLKSNGALDSPRADVDGTVYVITEQADGRIFIGGDFNTVNGLKRTRIARLGANFALDSIFYNGEGPDGIVFSVVLVNNGMLLAGGFQHIGAAKISRLAELDVNGRIDPTFITASGANNRILAAALAPQGKLLLGGNFRRYHARLEPYLCEILPNGGLERSFRGEVAGPVHAITLQRDGKILIAGEFNTVHNVHFKGIARLNDDGSLDPAFNPGAGADGTIETLALQSDGKIILGGEFTTINGTPRDHLARLNPDGSLDSAFAPKFYGSDVRKVLVQRDGRILVAGQFTSVEGVNRIDLVRLKPQMSIK